jgi:hypothetical protein
MVAQDVSIVKAAQKSKTAKAAGKKPTSPKRVTKKPSKAKSSSAK